MGAPTTETTRSAPDLIDLVLRADLRRRGRRLTLTAVLVAVVVGAALAPLLASRRTAEAFARYEERTRPITAFVIGDGPAADVERLEQIPGIDAAVGLEWFAVFPAGGPEGLVFAPLVVPGDRRVPSTYLRYPVVSGRMPDPRQPDEIAVGERMARRLGVGVGGTVPTVSFTPAQVERGDVDEPEGPEVPLRVVGVVRTPGDVAGREGDVDAVLLTPSC